MATRSPFPAIIIDGLWLMVWIIGLQSSLAKECTNIPTQGHTTRSLLFEEEELRTNISSSYRRLPLSSQSNSSLAASSRNTDLTGVLLKTRHTQPLELAEQQRAARRKSRGAELLDSFTRRGKSLHHQNASKILVSDSDSMGLLSTSVLRRRGSEFENSPSLKEVSLHRVRLAPDSLQGIAQETNLQYLLMLDVDSLVWSFRVTAGLPSPGSPYGGWEYPTMELRGHFVGHYLSATALAWASTCNEVLLEKMIHLVDALEECQYKMGTGYLSAFPSEYFDRFEAIRPVWAPYYTIHKIMAGLLDQYVLVGSEKSLGMLLWMAEYFLRRVETVIHNDTIERHWESLNEEVGGMNDIMYRLFMLTEDPDHLKLAHLFDKPCFLGLLALQDLKTRFVTYPLGVAQYFSKTTLHEGVSFFPLIGRRQDAYRFLLQTDGLSGFHSNTHIPLVVGAQMRFEATGDKLYAELSQYFMDTINTSHRYATGGTSVSEFWTYPNRNGDALGTENEETCTTYNMLKVARNMYRWTKDISYAEYYERTLVNGILGVQRGKEPGVMIYMLPQAPGTSKAVSYHGWGTPYNAFWCCYGTGIESFSKLGDSIYFEDNDKKQFILHVVQFASSNLTWDPVGLLLRQKVLPLSSSDPYLHITFGFDDLPQGGNGNQAELSLRIPSWTLGATSTVNLNGLSMGTPKPGNYFSMKRAWKAGDVLQLDLYVSLALETIQDDQKHFSSLHAILFGPYLLAGMTDGECEIRAVNISSLSSWIVPVPASYSAQLFTFSQDWPAGSLSATLKGSEAQGFGGQAFVLSYGSTSAAMKSIPQEGTNEAAQATFLLNSLSVGTPQDSLIGRLVSFELYSQPGRLLAHTGVNGNLIAVDKEARQQPFRKSVQPSNNETSTTHLEPANYSVEGLHDEYKAFRVLPGLSGDSNTVSFEVATMGRCFVVSDRDATVKVQCQSEPEGRDPNFEKKATFRVNKGLATYNPVSFFANGVNRQYLLFPIFAYLDERYATYFNLTSA